MATRSRSESARRRLPPEERRQELLDAAIRVMRARGVHNCRVEDVTTAAGTAKGNFYRYFATWDELLVAVRDQILDVYANDMRARFAARETIDWWVALEDEVDEFLTFQLHDDGLHEAVFHGPAHEANPVAEERNAATLIGFFLQGGIDAGAFAPVDVTPTAALFFHLLHGAADEIRAGRPYDDMRSALLRMMTRTLTTGS